MVLPAVDVPDLPTTSTEPTAQADTTPPPTLAIGVVSEAAVGLPVESGGSVYDPSKAQAHAISATDRLRSAAAPSEDSPARVDPLSLAEHAPLPPSSLHPADRSGTRVEVAIDPSGIAIEFNVIEGSGDAALDAAILEAARTWSYEPARADGAAVMSRLQLDVILERGVDSDGPAMLD
jgi:TonB family protein